MASSDPPPGRPGGRTPAAPRHLTEEAKAVWRRLAPVLHARGELRTSNREILATYCDLVIQQRRAAEALAVGQMLKGRRDGLVTNPAWRIYRDAAALAATYAKLLGLLPEHG